MDAAGRAVKSFGPVEAAARRSPLQKAAGRRFYLGYDPRRKAFWFGRFLLGSAAMKFPYLLAGLVVTTSIGFSADQPAAAPSAMPAPAAAPAPVPDPTAPARLAEAQVLMQNMHFEDTMMQVLNSRKEQMARMIDQSAMMMPAGGATPAEIADYKKQMMDTWWGEVKPDQTLKQMAQVYADLFSVDDLKGMSDFYQSSAGQALVAKTLDLQQKSSTILTARMQAAMPLMQKIQKDFIAAHPAKPKPAPAAAPAASPPPAPAVPAPAPSASAH
jgi:hypothetical protein